MGLNTGFWIVCSRCCYPFGRYSLLWPGRASGWKLLAGDKVKPCQHLTNPVKKVTVFVDFTVARSTCRWRPESAYRGRQEVRRQTRNNKPRGDIDDAIHGDSQSGREIGSRSSAEQGNLSCDGEV